MQELCKQSEGTVQFPIQGAGNETRSFIFIDDMIAGLLTVIEQGEHLAIYHIGTEDETTIKELAWEVARHFNREIEIVPGQLQCGGTLRRCPSIRRQQRGRAEPCFRPAGQRALQSIGPDR